jgi:hypothetical protein
MNESDGSRRSPVPIVGALAVVLAALAVFWVLQLVAGDTQPDETLVGLAAVGQNDALQRGDYADFRMFTCIAEQGTESGVLADQRQSSSAKGARFVDDVTGIAVAADRATATVIYHFEKAPEDKISSMTTFVRENGRWTVCSPGPR